MDKSSWNNFNQQETVSQPVPEVNVVSVPANVLGVLQLRPVVPPPGQAVELGVGIVGIEPVIVLIKISVDLLVDQFLDLMSPKFV